MMNAMNPRDGDQPDSPGENHAGCYCDFLNLLGANEPAPESSLSPNSADPPVAVEWADNPTSPFQSLVDFYVANCPEITYQQAEALWALYRGER